jgi:hypothetical protein
MTSATILILGYSPFQADSSPCADVFGPSAWAAETITVAKKKTPAVALYNLLMSSNYAVRETRLTFARHGAEVMRTWLRSLVNAILGKVSRQN